jgi:hypothetical protein
MGQVPCAAMENRIPDMSPGAPPVDAAQAQLQVGAGHSVPRVHRECYHQLLGALQLWRCLQASVGLLDSCGDMLYAVSRCDDVEYVFEAVRQLGADGAPRSQATAHLAAVLRARLHSRRCYDIYTRVRSNESQQARQQQHARGWDAVLHCPRSVSQKVVAMPC